MSFFESSRLSTSEIFLWIEEVDNPISSINARFFIAFASRGKKPRDWTICICIGTLRRPLKLEFCQSILLLHAIVNVTIARQNVYNFLCYENKLQNSCRKLKTSKMSWIIKLFSNRINFYEYMSIFWFTRMIFSKNYIIDCIIWINKLNTI